MSRRLRTSKYKHTRGAEYKREQWYADIQVGDCGGDSNQIAASATYIAYPGSTGGGGSLSLLNVASVGKQSLENIFTVSGHSAKVTDFSFSPFADNVLATGSEDANIAVWELPEDGLTENVGGSPMAMLAGHGRRVEALEWNPVARNVIGSVSQDRTLKIWDVAQSADVLTLDGFGEQPQAMCWNFEGSLVAATCKDKVVRLFDPRADGLVAEAPSHQGLKATRVTWMGDSPFFVTSGFSKMRKRELWVWDATAMDAPVKKISLDSSTGVLMPMYDADTKILVVTGKGDSGTRYYEFAPDANKTQYLYEIGTVAGTDPHSGACLLPKRSMSFMDCEVIRLLKLGSKDVLTVKFEVPRKSHSEYHPDIYPDTRGTEPACEADEWFAGDNNTVVPLIDLTPAVTRTYNLRDDPEPAATSTSTTGASGGAGGSGPAAGPKIKPKKIVAKKWGSGGGSKWGSGNTAGRRWSRDQTAAAVAAREPQEEEDPMANMREVVVPKVVRTSKFRHVRGKGTKAEETFFDLRLSQVTTTECNLIQANQLFFCIPYAGAAGHLAIFPLDHPGKTPVEWPTFHHSAAFMDWAFNPFDDYMIGAGTEDAHVHIYRVPTADGLEETITSPAVDFSGHSRKVSVVHWHPLAENVLVSGSSDATVRIWDVESEQDRGVLDCFGDQVFDFAFSPRGDLMATASKDKTLRVVDPRSGEVSGEVQAHSALTAWKVHWSPDRDHIISVGYGRGSKREIKVWDPRSLAEPLYFKPLGLGSSYTISFYDPGTGIIFLGGKGDGNIKMFEYNDEGIHILPDYQSGSPQNGLAYLPKHACDVTQVEFARMMKLSVDVVEPLSFTVPRTRKEFFQDDLFPDCYPPYPTYSAGEWFDGETRDVELVSLQPEGMEKVSEQETERRPVRKWVPKTIEAADTRSTRDKLMGNFNNLIDDFASDEIPQDANEGVDAEEWTA